MANKRYHMLQKSPETIALIAVAKKLLAGDQLHTYDSDVMRYALRFLVSELYKNGHASISAGEVASAVHEALKEGKG